MALKKITANDFNTAINILTTSDKSVWWKYLDSTDDGTELCLAVGWQDGYDEDADLYQQDGYTLCAKIGYKHSNTMVMDYSDFREPYDKKGNVWQTDMAVAKGPISDSDVKWYNDEAEAIWSKYGVPNSDGTTALDLMESKKKSEARPSYYDHPLLMAATAGGKTIYSATEDGDMFTDDEKEAYVFRNFDIISSIAEEDFLKVAKHYLGKTAKVDYVPAKGAEESKKSEAKKPIGSMQKKIESLKKKSEGVYAHDIYGTVRVAAEDIAIKVQEIEERPSTNGYSLTKEVPQQGAWFNDLSEFKDCVDGLAENCNGYPTISREDSDIIAEINAPIEDANGEFTGDYEVIVKMRCSTEITNTSLQAVVDLLNGD